MVQLIVSKASVGKGKVWLRYVAELQVPSVESFISYGFVLQLLAFVIKGI